MSKLVQVNIFTNLLDQFLDFLEVNFKEHRSDIMITKSSIHFIQKSNPRVVVEKFMLGVYPYKEYIMACDEKFFMNFEKNIKEISSDDMLTGLKIKNLWNSECITEEQKAYIWLYFQKLIKAGEKVIM